MRRLMAICPEAGDATSFYRGIGPLSRLQKDLPNLNLIITNRIQWDTVRLSDAVFLQRPFSADHLQVVKIVKSCRTPLWVDFDDDLFAVPSDNPTSQLYGNPEIQKNIAQMIAMADVVTVSTGQLKEKFSRLNKNIVVVPNGLDESVFCRGFRSERSPERKKLVYWRGSKTHTKDLLTVAPQLVSVANDPELKDWTFHFMGDNPWFVTDHFPKAKALVTKGLDPFEYMKFLNESNPAIMIVPLDDSEFNRSKSNIAWIEGMYCGAVVIAPALPEFQKPGVLQYESPEEFEQRLRDAMSSRYDFAALAAEGWDHVLKKYTLLQSNRIRARVLHDLIEKTV